jgi:hypothetical protein
MIELWPLSRAHTVGRTKNNRRSGKAILQRTDGVFCQLPQACRKRISSSWSERPGSSKKASESRAAMIQVIVRFLVGGLWSLPFAVAGDLLIPKSIAGLFGAAPSVALATLGLTIASDGLPMPG